MDTFTRVRQIVAEALNLSEAQITPQSSLITDLPADSLDRIEIVMSLEEAFCFEFDEASLSLTTIQQIVDYIDARKGAQDRPSA